MKKIRHLLEYVVIKTILSILGRLDIATASNIGGWVARVFCPLLGVNKNAVRNLKMAIPELDDKQIKEIISKMWDNLGRVVAELPHMAKLTPEKFNEIAEIEGLENIEKMSKNGGFFFTGHIGNWELAAIAPYLNNCPIHIVYRTANNPYVDKMINGFRSGYKKAIIPKGSAGARQIIKALRQSDIVGMLIDQKQNDGLSVPFFGHDAMTASAIVNLSMKYDCYLSGIQIIRTKGHKFKVKIYEPFKFTDDDNELSAMTKLNKTLEGWIRENPGQWFWMHNRWPRAKV